jgi:hypothetical protein
MLDTVTAPRRPFTPADVANRSLVITMLRYEDSVMLGPQGAAIFADETLPHLTDLDTYHIFHRMTLAVHGFTTTDMDVKNYRAIFSHYYAGPSHYDAEVLNSVCYMRENKCVYYTAPSIHLGDGATDVELLTITGESSSLVKELEALPHKYVFVGAFSHS